MLTITVTVIPEQFDEETEKFIDPVTVKLQMEHSLVSISEWESKWHKSFISTPELTDEETFDYIKCMTLTDNVPDEVYECLSDENIQEIKDYIANPMTATTFSDDKKGRGSREKITSELIYYWMITWNIPVKFEKWHLNRLITLIRVCSIKNQPSKKMSQKDIASRNAMLNAQRRAKLNSKG